MLDNVDGRKIRMLRQAAGLSESDLGIRVGLSQAAMSHIEIGFKQPSARTLKRIARVFGCTTDELYECEPAQTI